VKAKKIVIVGAGKIAYSLTDALIKGGFEISLVISKNIDSARKLAHTFHINIYSDKIDSIQEGPYLVFISVPDSQIEIVAKKLSLSRDSFKDFVFIHLSGAFDNTLLDTLRKKKAETASLHIMQTFPSRKPISIKGCFAAVETRSNKTERLLFNIAKEISLKPFKLTAEEKTYYHLAGVFISNFMIGNFFDAESIFNMKNVHTIDLMEPIITSTLKNIKHEGVKKALTGPVERGDIGTIKKHISALKKLSLQARNNTFLLNYLSQSLNLIEATKTKYGKSSPSHQAIKKLLNNEAKKIINKLSA